MSTSRCLILNSENHSQLKESRLFEEMTNLRTGAGNYKINLGYFVPESKEISKEWW